MRSFSCLVLFSIAHSALKKELRFFLFLRTSLCYNNLTALPEIKDSRRLRELRQVRPVYLSKEEFYFNH